jgi:hypothetical protein
VLVSFGKSCSVRSKDIQSLKQNLQANCIPETIFNMTVEDYDAFLDQRRMLVAKKIRDYYFSL